MAGKVETYQFRESRARVWQAAVQSVASLGYTVLHSDRESGTLSFNTGRSMSSWGGQDLTATISASGSGTVMTMGGSLARGGNPFGGGSQVVAWGEKGKLINKFAQKVMDTVPSIPEPTVESTATTAQTPNLADELAKLAQLRDSGALSEDEFAAAKRRLIEDS